MRRFQHAALVGLVFGVLLPASAPGQAELEVEPTGHTLGDQTHPGASPDPFRQRERLRDSERNRNRNLYRYWEEDARSAEDQRPKPAPGEPASIPEPLRR